MDDYRYKALQTLTRARFYAVQNLTREKQRFANYLFMKCSGLAQGKVLSQNTSATTIALMEQFETVDDLAYIDLNELTVFITKSGRGRFSDPASTAKAVQTAAKGSYRLPKTVNDSVNQAMSVSIAAMRALESQIKTLDKAIEQQFEIIPNTLTSIPGIGKCIRRALSPRSATSTAFSLRPLLPSLPALSGLSTSPATTRRRIPT
jgi:endonuclease III